MPAPRQLAQLGRLPASPGVHPLNPLLSTSLAAAVAQSYISCPRSLDLTLLAMAAMSTGDPLARLGLSQHPVVIVAESKSSACLEGAALPLLGCHCSARWHRPARCAPAAAHAAATMSQQVCNAPGSLCDRVDGPRGCWSGHDSGARVQPEQRARADGDHRLVCMYACARRPAVGCGRQQRQAARGPGWPKIVFPLLCPFLTTCSHPAVPEEPRHATPCHQHGPDGR